MIDKDKYLGTGSTSTSDSRTNSTTQDTHIISEVVSSEQVMNVGISMSKTVNLGNYENIKLQVSCHCPCTIGEQDGVFEFAQDWCDTKLGALLDEVQEAT